MQAFFEDGRTTTFLRERPSSHLSWEERIPSLPSPMMALRSPVATIPLSGPRSSMVLSHMNVWSISLTLFHTGRTRALTIHPIFPGLMVSKKESKNILPISLRIEKASSCLFHYTGYDSPFLERIFSEAYPSSYQTHCKLSLCLDCASGSTALSTFRSSLCLL